MERYTIFLKHNDESERPLFFQSVYGLSITQLKTLEGLLTLMSIMCMCRNRYYLVSTFYMAGTNSKGFTYGKDLMYSLQKTDMCFIIQILQIGKQRT